MTVPEYQFLLSLSRRLERHLDAIGSDLTRLQPKGPAADIRSRLTEAHIINHNISGYLTLCRESVNTLPEVCT